MKRNDETHILALDVRHSRIGYALFSGPNRLLDWGAHTIPSRCKDRAHWIRQRMAALIQYGSPTSIVAKQQWRVRLPRNASGEPIFKTVQSAAEECDIPMHVLGRDEIQSAFHVFQARSKDEIACVLVGLFPELLVRLPPKRKKWQPEPHGMIVFDAIATGFAYWRQSSSHR